MSLRQSIAGLEVLIYIFDYLLLKAVLVVGVGIGVGSGVVLLTTVIVPLFI